MGRLEFSTPRDAWGGEATAFTPLLAQSDMLDYLGEAIGIGPLVLIEREHPTAGNRSLDILAETSDGRRVAIENQYKTADHDHMTRGLAYAVATESSALVVVAEGHRDEFISVANYLNEIALASQDAGILVWLVQVRGVRRIGDTVWSPEFVVRAEPNEWEASVRLEVSPKLGSLEEYYSRCSSANWASFARGTIEPWLTRPGTREGHDTQSVIALYHPTPRQPKRGTNIVQLGLNGQVTICRGYIWGSSGAFDPDEEPAELDHQIANHFPNAQWGDKNYYIRVDDDHAGLEPFLDWIAGFMTQRCDDIETQA